MTLEPIIARFTSCVVVGFSGESALLHHVQHSHVLLSCPFFLYKLLGLFSIVRGKVEPEELDVDTVTFAPSFFKDEILSMTEAHSQEMMRPRFIC